MSITQSPHGRLTGLDSRARVAAIAVAVVVALTLTGSLLLRAYQDSMPRPAPLPDRPFALSPARVPDPEHSPRVIDTSYDHLVIPSLDVDAPLETGGVVAGQLELPEDIAHTTMWTGSAPIGARGGAILVAGHLNDAQQHAGALHDLSTVTAGSSIIVVRDHAVTQWKVTGLAVADKQALPAGIWAGATGATRVLYVITCGGPIVAGHYADNIVVTATPASTRKAVA